MSEPKTSRVLGSEHPALMAFDACPPGFEDVFTVTDYYDGPPKGHCDLLRLAAFLVSEMAKSIRCRIGNDVVSDVHL
jgi:hypothetical protein